MAPILGPPPTLVLVGHHRDRRIERVGDAGLEQQRDLDYRDVGAALPCLSCFSGLSCLQLAPPGGDPASDTRKEDPFEPAKLARVLEDDLGHRRSVDRSIPHDTFSPAGREHIAKLLGGEQLVNDLIGGQDGGTQPLAGGKGLGLAGADASGQPDEEQRLPGALLLAPGFPLLVPAAFRLGGKLRGLGGLGISGDGL